MGDKAEPHQRATAAATKTDRGGHETALVRTEQRRVTVLAEDEIVAVRTPDGAIYLPVKPLCLNLGINDRGQIQRIRRDKAMAEGLRQLRVETPARGLQPTQCLLLDFVPYWLSTVDIERVRPDAQERLLAYKTWVIRKVFEAFQQETGIGRDVEVAPPAHDEVLSLAHIRDMGLAIAAFAEQQIAFAAQQQAQDRRIDILEEGHGQLSVRLDRAAGVVGGLVRSVKALEQRLAPGNVLSEEQAAEVSDRVKTVAEALTARDVAAGAAPRDWYGSLYRTLYKRYNVAGYRRIRQEQYADVLSWLDDFHETASPPLQANGEE